jgi:hypothetical protein
VSLAGLRFAAEAVAAGDPKLTIASVWTAAAAPTITTGLTVAAPPASRYRVRSGERHLDHLEARGGSQLKWMDHPRRPSVLRFHFLAAFLKEAAERPGERGDHSYRVDLHEDVEDSRAGGDRVLERRGDGQ